MKYYVKEKRQHKMNMAEMFNVIHGQCTKEFIDQMRTYPEYKAANDGSDVFALAQVIKKICYQQNSEIYKSQAILLSLKVVLQCLLQDSSNINYFEKLRCIFQRNSPGIAGEPVSSRNLGGNPFPKMFP